VSSGQLPARLLTYLHAHDPAASLALTWSLERFDHCFSTQAGMTVVDFHDLLRRCGRDLEQPIEAVLRDAPEVETPRAIAEAIVADGADVTNLLLWFVQRHVLRRSRHIALGEQFMAFLNWAAKSAKEPSTRRWNGVRPWAQFVLSEEYTYVSRHLMVNMLTAIHEIGAHPQMLVEHRIECGDLPDLPLNMEAVTRISEIAAFVTIAKYLDDAIARGNGPAALNIIDLLEWLQRQRGRLHFPVWVDQQIDRLLREAEVERELNDVGTRFDVDYGIDDFVEALHRRTKVSIDRIWTLMVFKSICQPLKPRRRLALIEFFSNSIEAGKPSSHIEDLFVDASDCPVWMLRLWQREFMKSMPSP
jgi:hypothetical protein